MPRGSSPACWRRAVGISGLRSSTAVPRLEPPEDALAGVALELAPLEGLPFDADERGRDDGADFDDFLLVRPQVAISFTVPRGCTRSRAPVLVGDGPV